MNKILSNFINCTANAVNIANIVSFKVSSVNLFLRKQQNSKSREKVWRIIGQYKKSALLEINLPRKLEIQILHALTLCVRLCSVLLKIYWKCAFWFLIRNKTFLLHLAIGFWSDLAVRKMVQSESVLWTQNRPFVFEKHVVVKRVLLLQSNIDPSENKILFKRPFLRTF